MTPGYAMKLAAELGREIRREHGEDGATGGSHGANAMDTQGNPIPRKDDKLSQSQRDIIREHRAVFGRE